jgi:hypothetical protein
LQKGLRNEKYMEPVDRNGTSADGITYTRGEISAVQSFQPFHFIEFLYMFWGVISSPDNGKTA